MCLVFSEKDSQRPPTEVFMQCFDIYSIGRNWYFVQFDETGVTNGPHLIDRDERRTVARMLVESGNVSVDSLVGGGLPYKPSTRDALLPILENIGGVSVNAEQGYWFAPKELAGVVREALGPKLSREVSLREFRPFYEANKADPDRGSRGDQSLSAPWGRTLSGKD